VLLAPTANNNRNAAIELRRHPGRRAHIAADRVADVFPDEQAISGAGFLSQDTSDLLAVLGPRLVGIPANNIRAFLKAMAGWRLSEWQAEEDELRAAASASRQRRNRR
jgi:hypothetical protein